MMRRRRWSGRLYRRRACSLNFIGELTGYVDLGAVSPCHIGVDFLA